MSIRYRKDVIRQERSMVVNGRVDVVELAEIARAFKMMNIHVKSVSHLMSLIVSQIHYAMRMNDFILDEGRIDSLTMAWDVLRAYHLTTQSMEKQNRNKLRMARGFENMRREGANPEFNAPDAYKQLHNPHSVNPIGDPSESVTFDIDRMTKIYNDLEKKEEDSKPKETEEEMMARLLGKTIEEYREYVESGERDRMLENYEKEKEQRKRDAELADERRRAKARQRELEQKAKDKLAKQRAKRIAECEMLSKDDEEVRALTEEELAAKGKDIESRDRDLATMDMSAPKTNEIIK